MPGATPRTMTALAALAAACLLAPLDTAVAQTPKRQADVEQSTGQQLTIAVGKSAIVELPRDAAEVFVGQPDVANAIVRTSRKLFVLGVGNGQTSIYALDKDGNKIVDLDVRIGRDVSELRSILKTAMPTAQVEAKTVNDTIILTGEVDSASDAQKAEDIARAFVGYSVAGMAGSVSNGGVSFGSSTVVQGKLINSLTIRGRDQVMVKVAIAEVRRDIVKQLGIDPSGAWKSGSFSATQTMSKIVSETLPRVATGNWATGFGTLGASLSALERNGVARVLAEPTVAAISGESAKFIAGGQIPLATSSDFVAATGTTPASCSQRYTLQKYGVSLAFTPIVLSEGRIQMHVSTEVTELDNSVGPSKSPCANLPGLRTRANETTLELPSGGSMVSAGLIQQRSRQHISGQPGLMNLPVLGALFRSRDFQKEETELMIIMTPYVVKPARVDQLARPDDGFRDASDGQSIFLGRVNRVYSTSRNPEIVKSLKGRVGFIAD